MAAAAGFARPTKTGGFGESLGYAMENYAAETEKDIARKQAADKAKLEMLQQQQKMQNQSLLFENELRMAGYGPEEITTLTSGASKAPAPAGAPAIAGAPAGAPSAEGAPTAPRQQRPITEQDIRITSMLDTERGKQLMELAKFQRDKFLGTPQGLVNRDTGLAHDTGLEASFEKTIPYIDVQKITQTQNREIEALKKKYPVGSSGRENAFSKYYFDEGFGGVTYKPAVEGKPAESSMKTAAEREADKLQTAENIKKQTESLQKSKDKIYADAENAKSMLNNANFVYKFATNPATEGAFGVLSQGNVGGAIGTLVAEGVSTPNGSIKVAGLENAVRLITGTPAEVAAAQQLASNYAELELAYRKKYFEGTGGGAISDKEQAVVQRIGGNLSDTAKVAAAKAEIIQARGKFDQTASNIFYEWEEKNPNRSFQTFKRSQEYRTLVDNYDLHMDKLFDKYYGNTAPVQSAPAGNVPAAPSTPAVKPPANENPVDKFKREKAEREKAARGNQ